MAIKNNVGQSAPTEKAEQTSWTKIAIPDAKLKLIWTDAKTGKTSMAFEPADASGCKGVFYVPVKLVRRNNDATGFIVSMPEKPIKITERVTVNGNVTSNKYEAECVADLGFPEVK